MRAGFLPLPVLALLLGACVVPDGGPTNVYAGPPRVYAAPPSRAVAGPGIYYGARPSYGWSRPGYGYGASGWGGGRYGYGSPYAGRSFSPDRRVDCDRATRICYKRGEIDKSETEDAFGDRAADRADDIRDRYGRADLFVTRRGTVCDDDRDVCFKDGRPDRSDTRDRYGKGAAKRIR